MADKQADRYTNIRTGRQRKRDRETMTDRGADRRQADMEKED